MTKETIIKSALKYLVKRQIAEGSVGFAVDNDHDHDCCWDDVLAWLEAQPSEEDFVKHKKEVLERIAKREREIDKYIKELDALEQQPCEDCVSRQAVLDVINFEDEWLFDAKSHNADTKIAFSAIKSKISELPSVTPRRDLAETSQDCISREEVQDLISRWLSDYLLDETREALETINYKVGDMPSVTPQRKRGKWIVISCEPTDIFKCSECGMRVINPYRYCPMCGSYNGGGEDEVSD